MAESEDLEDFATLIAAMDKAYLEEVLARQQQTAAGHKR